MKCPHCNKELTIHDNSHPFNYVRTYGGFARARTKCCKKIVSISPVINYNAVAVPFSVNQEDDWGN